MSAIFISHSTKDNADAAAMGAWLEEQGHRYYFIDYDEQSGIRAGAEWEQVLSASETVSGDRSLSDSRLA